MSYASVNDIKHLSCNDGFAKSPAKVVFFRKNKLGVFSPNGTYEDTTKLGYWELENLGLGIKTLGATEFVMKDDTDQVNILIAGNGDILSAQTPLGDYLNMFTVPCDHPFLACWVPISEEIHSWKLESSNEHSVVQLR